ncbi:MAG: hypothetical protein Q8S84_04475 [bacterium]|nr:hypothetical protein [bacterium]
MKLNDEYEFNLFNLNNDNTYYLDKDICYKRRVDRIINPSYCENCFLRENIWVDRLLKQEELFIPYYQ